MSKNAVPDAWDDDWEAQADKMAAEPAAPEPEVKLSKAQRKAKHQAENRQLWEDADAVKEQPIFLQARAQPAYKTEFKGQTKVLARKPPPKVAARGDATGAMAGLKLQDDEDSDEEERKKAAAEFEERKARAIREREEKQRKYQEARARIFGSDGGDDATKRPVSSGEGSRNSSRGKGRGGRRENEVRGGTGSGEQSPARASGGQKKQLYDPSYTEKSAGGYVSRRANTESGRSTPSGERPIREPKGPDGSGRGGFGFAPRGGKGVSA